MDKNDKKGISNLLFPERDIIHLFSIYFPRPPFTSQASVRLSKHVSGASCLNAVQDWTGADRVWCLGGASAAAVLRREKLTVTEPFVFILTHIQLLIFQ